MRLEIHHLQSEWGLLMLETALLEAEGKSERVFFRYTLTSEEEQKEFLRTESCGKRYLSKELLRKSTLSK